MPAPDLNEALKSLNQTSALDWADEFPTASIVELARKLPGGVSPVALQNQMLEEARERKQVPRLMRAVLVRLLNGEFPRGLNGTAEEGQAGLEAAFSMWQWLFDPDQRTAVSDIWSKLVTALEAKPSWVPQSPDEPAFVALFAGHELHRSKKATLVANAHARLETALEGKKTSKERLDALAGLPLGYRLVYATEWVDAAIRGGGFSQLYGNGGGIELPLALKGFHALKQDGLVAILEESLAYARAHHRERLNPGMLTEPATSVPYETPRLWAPLERAYLEGAPDLFEAVAALIESSPALFEPPFRELKNADGTTWKVRTSGVLVEIKIELNDGTSIARERRCASTEKAELEVLSLIKEQLQDGFVEAR